jgi:2-phospho-L-lactate guanylyltransferase (CobY/MobA/RfbA family)
VRIFESGELALDIDDPEDLDAWRGYDSRNDSYGSGERRESAVNAGSRGGVPGRHSDDIIRPG